MYDIASLTKVVATTTLVAKLAEGDFPVPLDLDAQVDRYLPEWSAGLQAGQGLTTASGANGEAVEWRSRVTVRHLLTHTSGLPPFKEYWRTSKSKARDLGEDICRAARVRARDQRGLLRPGHYFDGGDHGAPDRTARLTNLRKHMFSHRWG